MHRLILLRHAKTEPWSDNADDHGRALTERGKEDAQLIAAELKRRGWQINTALISTARRTRETWRVVAETCPQAELRLEDDLYLASPEMIRDLVARNRVDSTLIVIGHNPGLHEAACDLARLESGIDPELMKRLVATFPTGCAAFFEAADRSSAGIDAMRLLDVVHPKDLRPA